MQGMKYGKKLFLLAAMIFFLTGSWKAGKVYADILTADLTLNGTFVSRSLADDKDVHRYTVTLPSSGRLTVTYQGWDIYDSYYSLLNAELDKDYFQEEVWPSSDTEPVTAVKSLFLEKGTYCLSVQSDGNHHGKYKVKAEFVAANNTETEPNNSFDTAMNLAANVKITGLISENDTIDFYKITVPSGQKGKVTYQGMLSDSYVSVWDADSVQLYEKEVWTATEEAPITYTFEEELAAGVYYIKVVPYSVTDRGRYTLIWTGSGTPAPTPETPKDETPKDTTPKNGQQISVSDQQYTVMNAGEVSYTRQDAASATVKIPATITVGGVKYKVTSVSSKAFAGNQNITKVVIGKNVKKIGTQAFANCRRLKTVKFGKSVTTIGNKAFYNCSALTKIDLPKSVKKIGTAAFKGCSKAKKIIIRSSALAKSKVGSRAFTGTPAAATVYVPASKVGKYRKVLKGLGKKAMIVSLM